MGNIMGMRRKTPALCAVVSALAAMGLAGALRADLAPASPFMPPNSGAAAAGAAGAGGPIELRGVMSTSEGSEYCIYDTVKKSSAWVGLNEAGQRLRRQVRGPVGRTASRSTTRGAR
jgi:hypothetical protein